MEIKNEINNNTNVEKNNALNNVLGKTINFAIDIGLKSILPDLIENQVIEIKDSLIQNGLKDGIQTAVDSAIEFGKSVAGIFTGNFENMTQVRTAVADGGIIDTVSDLLDKVVDKCYISGHINESVSTLIKSGKDILLENVSSSIKEELDKQTDIVGKIGRYVDNWKECYNKKDFVGMSKEYNKIKEQEESMIPVESILKERKKVEILHNLIKNNGQNFEITDLEKKLAENLST